MFCRRHCRIYSPKIPTSNSVCHGRERVCVTVFRRTDLLHQICRLRPSWRPRTWPPNRKHGPVSGFLWHSLWRFCQNWGNRLRSKAPTCFYLQLCKFRLSYTSLHAPMCVRVCVYFWYLHMTVSLKVMRPPSQTWDKILRQNPPTCFVCFLKYIKYICRCVWMHVLKSWNYRQSSNHKHIRGSFMDFS